MIYTELTNKALRFAYNAHNSDQSRCIGSDLSEEQLAYWRQKCQKAREILVK